MSKQISDESKEHPMGRSNEAVGKDSLQVIGQEVRYGAVSVKEATPAKEKLGISIREMQRTTKQREERHQRKTRVHTRELWCTMNMGPLGEIVKEHGEGRRRESEGEEGEEKEVSRTQTVGDDATELSKRIRRRKDGTGSRKSKDSTDKHSEKGRDLYMQQDTLQEAENTRSGSRPLSMAGRPKEQSNGGNEEVEQRETTHQHSPGHGERWYQETVGYATSC